MITNPIKRIQYLQDQK